MAAHDEPTQSDDLDAHNEVDLLCDEFETIWRSGRAPEIDEFLERTSPVYRSTLLLELVRLDIEYRSKTGQSQSIEDYAHRYPDYQNSLSVLHSDSLSERARRLAGVREIGSLRLIQEIGAGTFGVVWKAWDSRLEREVAVKLPTEMSLGRDYAAEFRREAQSAAGLRHPGIVRVIDYGVQNEIAYIVYELVKGVTLKQWAQRNQVSPRRAAGLCRELADALAHAHANGVVHRDLKPGNIMMDVSGNALVTDFGLAKRDAAASTVAGSGVIIGTLAYMSPEQAEGKSGSIDGRTDVYALGAILYWLLSEKTVFSGSASEILKQILTMQPKPLSEVVEGIPRDIATICHKCIEKKRTDRYGTAVELSADLQRFLSDEPVLARPVSRYVRFVRLLKERRVTILWMTFSLVLLLVIVRSGPKDNRTSMTTGGQSGRPESQTVSVTTEPPGASILVIPCNPDTGEPRFSSPAAYESATPVSLELKGGRYRVQVSLMTEDGLRMHSVHRTVPGLNEQWPSRFGNWERYRVLSATQIEWPAIRIPPLDITDDMVYISGTPEFLYRGKDGLTRAKIMPFYVATHEFTYGDYAKLRPSAYASLPGPPARTGTMPVPYDRAEHGAEEAGCRLLTDAEFAYLA